MCKTYNVKCLFLKFQLSYKILIFVMPFHTNNKKAILFNHNTKNVLNAITIVGLFHTQ